VTDLKLLRTLMDAEEKRSKGKNKNNKAVGESKERPKKEVVVPAYWTGAKYSNGLTKSLKEEEIVDYSDNDM